MHASTFIKAAFVQCALAQAQAPLVDQTPRVSLNFPGGRGSSALVANIGPCQGYKLGGRIDYPLNGGVISWNALVDFTTIIRYSTSPDPSSQDDFTDVLTNVTDGWKGSQCIDGPDFGSLGLSAGDEITLQMNWNGGPRKADFFECADLRLISSDDFEQLNMETSCRNMIKSTQQVADQGANPNLFQLVQKAQAEAVAEQERTTNKNNGPLSVTEAGVVGAMVTLGVFAAVLAFAWIGGVLAFGRPRQALSRAKSGSFSSGEKATSVV
ncbi:hypothetical protein ACHAQA_000477 [Verticillium albo-atrum]